MNFRNSRMNNYSIAGLVGSIIYLIASFLPVVSVGNETFSILNASRLNDGLISPWIFIPVAFGMAVLFLKGWSLPGAVVSALALILAFLAHRKLGAISAESVKMGMGLYILYIGSAIALLGGIAGLAYRSRTVER